MIVDLKKLGQLVRKNRREKELTLRDLSDKTGLSIVHLWNIERNRYKTSPTLESVENICSALDIDTGELKKIRKNVFRDFNRELKD